MPNPLYRSEVEREYFVAANTALRTGQPDVAPFLTDVCPECGERVFAVQVHTGGHLVLDGHVVVGCEGYFVIDPALLGIDTGGWVDWRPAAR